MNKIFFLALIAILCSCGALHAQDFITLKNGEELRVIVTRVTPTEVLFKMYGDSQGDTYKMDKAKISKITYKNGSKEIFKDEQPAQPQNRNQQQQYENQQKQYQNQQQQYGNPQQQYGNQPQQNRNLSSGYQDVVYLKNGSIIRGVIIEQIPNRSIKIETADRNIYVFQINEIERIVKEPYSGNGSNSIKRTGTGLKSGYKGIVESGYQVGVGDYGMDRLSLDIINGGQIGPYFSMGFGTGFRYYYDAETILIPCFSDFRVNFINKKVSPYLSFGIGYSIDVTNSSDDYMGGALFNSTMGVTIKISDKFAINAGLGYEMQWMNTSNYYETSAENIGATHIVVSISF